MNRQTLISLTFLTLPNLVACGTDELPDPGVLTPSASRDNPARSVRLLGRGQCVEDVEVYTFELALNGENRWVQELVFRRGGNGQDAHWGNMRVNFGRKQVEGQPEVDNVLSRFSEPNTMGDGVILDVRPLKMEHEHVYIFRLLGTLNASATFESGQNEHIFWLEELRMRDGEVLKVPNLPDGPLIRIRRGFGNIKVSANHDETVYWIIERDAIQDNVGRVEHGPFGPGVDEESGNEQWPDHRFPEGTYEIRFEPIEGFTLSESSNRSFEVTPCGVTNLAGSYL